MKKVNPGFSALTKEQRDRALKHSVAAAKARPISYAKNNAKEFGVTRFANGQYLAQTITDVCKSCHETIHGRSFNNDI